MLAPALIAFHATKVIAIVQLTMRAGVEGQLGITDSAAAGDKALPLAQKAFGVRDFPLYTLPANPPPTVTARKSAPSRCKFPAKQATKQIYILGSAYNGWGQCVQLSVITIDAGACQNLSGKF